MIHTEGGIMILWDLRGCALKVGQNNMSTSAI